MDKVHATTLPWTLPDGRRLSCSPPLGRGQKDNGPRRLLALGARVAVSQTARLYPARRVILGSTTWTTRHVPMGIVTGVRGTACACSGKTARGHVPSRVCDKKCLFPTTSNTVLTHCTDTRATLRYPSYQRRERPFLMKRPATNLGQTMANFLLMGLGEGTGPG